MYCQSTNNKNYTTNIIVIMMSSTTIDKHVDTHTHNIIQCCNCIILFLANNVLLLYILKLMMIRKIDSQSHIVLKAKGQSTIVFKVCQSCIFILSLSLSLSLSCQNFHRLFQTMQRKMASNTTNFLLSKKIKGFVHREIVSTTTLW